MTSVMTQNDVVDIQEGLQIRALTFISKTMEQAGVMPRKKIINLTLGYLKTNHLLSDGTAEKIAVRALCEWESASFHQYIDVNETTAYCIAMKDPRLGVTRYFSILDIRNMLATAKLITLPTPSVTEAKAGPSMPLWPRRPGKSSFYNA